MSTAAEKPSILGNINSLDVSAPETSNNKLLFKTPGPEKPLVMKLIPDVRSGNNTNGYWPVTMFGHMVGPDPRKDTRSHPCQKSLGQKASPEADRYYAAYKRLDELKKSGQGNSDEAKVVEATIKKFKPSSRGWLTFVRPDSTVVEAIRVPKQVLNYLFGAKENSFQPAVPSLVKELGSKGMSPYDLRNPLGWIELYKTGEGLATKYTVKLHQVEVDVQHEGMTIKGSKPVGAKVHEKILGETTLDDIPDFREFEKKYAFTMEESIKFVESEGTSVPERFLNNGASEDGESTVVPTGEPSALPGMTPLAGLVPQTVSADDIPF